MNYWVTTKWPHLEYAKDNEPHGGIWVKDGKKEIINRVKIGDIVFFYESESGRSLIEKNTDGATKVVKRKPGSGGIVGIGEVIGNPREEFDSKEEKYTDGTTIWWRYHAPTGIVNSRGFIPRSILNDILNYEKAYNYRGFGDGKSGLKNISPEEGEQIIVKYNESCPDKIKSYSYNSHRHGNKSGGEGPEHKKLKLAVANNPSGLLKIPGLSKVDIEFSFATNDRIDILLKNNLGRYIVVEIEVDCDASEMAGPLQCMKYRALLAYLENITQDEISAYLVAHSIDKAVQKRCKLHNIECFEVSRKEI